MLNLFSILFLAAMDIGLAASFWVLPAQRRGGRFFGLKVDATAYAPERQKITFGYRIAVAGALAAASSLTIGLRLRGPMLTIPHAMVAGFVSLVVLLNAAYVVFAAKAAKLALAEPVEPVAAMLATRRFADFFDSRFELFIVIATLAPFALLAWLYPALPQQIPLPGQAASAQWAQKSFHLVFWRSIVNVYLQGFILVIKYASSLTPVTLPARATPEHLNLKLESVRLKAKMLDWFRAVVALTAILDLSWLAQTPDRVKLVETVGVIAALSVGVAGIASISRTVRRLRRLNLELERATGQIYTVRPAAVGHFHGGGLMYWNADDPAVVVETPSDCYTTGYTFNLANRWALLMVAYLAALPLVMAWGVLFR